MERLKIELNNEELNKSKWGVWPFIIHPKATNPSNLFIFLLIDIGISKAPGILKILILNLTFNNFFFLYSIINY